MEAGRRRQAAAAALGGGRLRSQDEVRLRVIGLQETATLRPCCQKQQEREQEVSSLACHGHAVLEQAPKQARRRYTAETLCAGLLLITGLRAPAAAGGRTGPNGLMQGARASVSGSDAGVL